MSISSTFNEHLFCIFSVTFLYLQFEFVCFGKRKNKTAACKMLVKLTAGIATGPTMVALVVTIVTITHTASTARRVATAVSATTTILGTAFPAQVKMFNCVATCC